MTTPDEQFFLLSHIGHPFFFLEPGCITAVTFGKTSFVSIRLFKFFFIVRSVLD